MIMSDMITLTTGDLRFINESTSGWRMMVRSAIGFGDDIPETVLERITELEDTYLEKFEEYFIKIRKAYPEATPDQIRDGFDEAFKTDHPEFFDMEMLLKG